MKPITTRFGLSSAPPGAVSISGEISITMDADCKLTYSEIYEQMAESTAYALKSALSSRLTPSDGDIKFLSEKAISIRNTRGEEYAREWLVSYLDPQKYSIDADFSVKIY